MHTLNVITCLIDLVFFQRAVFSNYRLMLYYIGNYGSMYILHQSGLNLSLRHLLYLTINQIQFKISTLSY